MRATEFITERMVTNWITGWVDRSAPTVFPTSHDLEWYAQFFKMLNNDKAFKAWCKANIVGPVTIKPKLLDDPNQPLIVMDAEHVVSNQPIKHDIVTTINVNPEIENEKQMKQFVDKLSARLTHELNHAHQVSQQFKGGRNEDDVFDAKEKIFSKPPPAPKNKQEEYYVYLLDSLEKDAWVSEIAQTLISKLGNDAIKDLENILKQATREDYAVVGSKIVQVPDLNGLYTAINYYGQYLKLGKEKTWNKIRKELYGYLTRHSNK